MKNNVIYLKPELESNQELLERMRECSNRLAEALERLATPQKERAQLNGELIQKKMSNT